MSTPQEQMPQAEVNPAPAEDFSQTPIKYEDEREEMLFGPTTRPRETFTGGAIKAPRRPRNLRNYAPELLRLAESPDAPDELMEFVRVMQYHMEGK